MKQLLPSPRSRQPHQEEAFNRFKDANAFALFWQQRVRKTKVILDIAAYRYARSEIDTLVIIAYPSGTHRVWLDEAPKDLPPDLPYKVVVWRSGKMGKKQPNGRYIYRPEMEELVTLNGLSILTINCEALLTDLCWSYLGKLLRGRKAMVVGDEISWAQSPSSSRTKRLLALGRHPNVVIKAGLDGTPATESPLNLYAPCAFLGPQLLGFSSFFTFRNRYAVLEEGYAAGGSHTFKKVVGYQNLDELSQKLNKFSSRLLRTDVSSAPVPTYVTRYFALTDKQRAAYNQLREQYTAELDALGTYPVAAVLKRMLRLQMIARNYWPPEREGQLCAKCEGEGCEVCDNLGVVIHTTSLQRIDPAANPAQQALVDELAASVEPTVIWCAFRQDVSDALEVASAYRAARYDGTVAPDEREAAYQGFRTGQYDTLVATIGSGLQRGKDLTRATRLAYYSNVYSARARQQSEDRAESLDRTISTGIIDLIAEDTRDLEIIELLRQKKSLEQLVLGDMKALL